MADCLESLRDWRIPFLERLQTAFTLYGNPDVVFPAKRQFILDWILDNLFRIAKGGAEKVQPIICSDVFWELFSSVIILPDSRYPLVFRKPPLPIFTLLLQNASKDCSERAWRCICQSFREILALQEVLVRTSLKYMQELADSCLQAVQDNALRCCLLREGVVQLLAEVLIEWSGGQNNKKKMYDDFYNQVLQLGRVLLSEDHQHLRQCQSLCLGLFQSFIFNQETVPEFVKALEGDEMLPIQQMLQIEQTVQLCRSHGTICAANLLMAFSMQSKVFFSSAEHRLYLVKFFARLAAVLQEAPPPTKGCPRPYMEDLIDVLVACEISSIQSDKAWDTCTSVFNQILPGQLAMPTVLAKILKIDYALLVPYIPCIFSTISALDSSWETFLLALAEVMCQARQLDLLCQSIVNSAQHYAVTADFVQRLYFVFVQMHPTALEMLSRSVLSLLHQPQESKESCSVLVLRFLTLFIAINPLLGVKFFDTIIAAAESEVSSVKNEAFLVLESIAENADGSLVDWSQLNKCVCKNPHQVGLSVLLVIKDRLDGDVFQKIGLFQSASSRSCVYKHFPPLVKRVPALICTLRDGVPPPMLKSALFWESFQSIDQLVELFTEKPSQLALVVESMPEGIVLPQSLATRCIAALASAQQAAHPAMDRLFDKNQPLATDIDPQVVGQIVKICSSTTLASLYERRWLEVDFLLRTPADLAEFIRWHRLLEVCAKDLGNQQLDIILQNFNLLLDSKGSSPFPLDSDGFIKLVVSVALLQKKRQKAEMKILEKASRGMDSVQLWRLRIALVESGCSEECVMMKSGTPDTQGYNITTEAVAAVLAGRAVELSTTQLSKLIRRESIENISSLLRDLYEIWLHGRFVDLKRLLQVLDAFLLQKVDTQTLACHVIDRIMVKTAQEDDGAPIEREWLHVLHRRALCGGATIGSLERRETFDALLVLVARLVVDGDTVPVVCSLMVALFQYHWILLMRQRPAVISILTRLVRWAETRPQDVRKIARVLSDFASHRQPDQHHYIAPLLLTLVAMQLPYPVRAQLTPAGCHLIRHLDQAVSAAAASVKNIEKYFNNDPFDRLMRMTEEDDGKAVLRSLVTTYRAEYKYSGKA